MPPIRLGLNVSTAATEGSDPVADARYAEELGFDFVSASDHPASGHPTSETWTMLTWIAARTSRIGVMTRVLGVPWRHPALTAKMAETLHRLSAGRLTLGLGGGADPAEFRSFGIPPRTPKDTVDGLDEAVRLIRALWTSPSVSCDGHLYRTDHAELEPKPSPPPPIWLGTFGNRALATTGRLADGWIPSYDMAPPQRAAAMRERILEAATDAGRDPASITCAYNIVIHLGDDRADQPGVVSGSAGAVTEQLLECVDVGFHTFNFVLSAADQRRQAQRIATEIRPALDAAAQH
jgi:alkanesulfonate monooxygenase SsuD/methylene tetrahydromethanopterin reductase-like flavin-dependent oxidoreductase (luciferase family)